MPYQKNSGGPSGKGDGRGQNGTKSSFRTDAAISNSRFAERTLQPWVPDATDGLDGSLETSNHGGHWDQFAENERRFGIKSDYDENIYTTTIDKSHPQYRERMAAAERKAREIERSQPTNAHVAEERVMDYKEGRDDGVNEEDKYSGVRRQDLPAATGRENKYTPPAKRAPSSQATVTGAPFDPAIISSQVRTTGKKTPMPKTEEAKHSSHAPANSGTGAETSQQTADGKSLSHPEVKTTEADKVSPPGSSGASVKTGEQKVADAKSVEKTTPPLRPAGGANRNAAPQTKEGSTPSAASTVERDVLQSFKNFATQQRQTADKIRSSKAKADKEVKLTELKKFASSFKLSTPVPNDLISIIAKDPHKQQEIQAKAIQNARDIAHGKDEAPASKDHDQSKDAALNKTVSAAATSQSGGDGRSTSRPNAPSQYASSPGSGGPGRHPNARQSYAAPSHHGQGYRNDRPGQSHLGQQSRQTLGQRLRNVEQQKLSQPPPQPHNAGPEVRMPPTGPAKSTESSFGRRLSGAPSHMGAKLNPAINEFKPGAFASPFSPAGGHPSAGSSPRSAVVNSAVDVAAGTPTTGQLIRRKTKAINVNKCFILSHVKTVEPPQGRNWDDNDGLRPSYDTPPTWRQIQDAEADKGESTMRLTYKEYLDQQSFAAPSHTPNPPLANTAGPHHYQLPLHLQQGTSGSAPRQSPNMASMPMHSQHGHMPHAPYNGMDEHRMVHSNSSQSFASPRMAQQVPVAYNPAVSSPGQVPYNQPMMQPFVGPGTPQMGGQYRSFSNNQQYMQQQPGHMNGPMMMQPQFMHQGLVPGPQMPMYGGPAQFAPPNAGPHQPIPGSNGFPSPGRPSAPMMAHQGSQQGQPVYGMSPNVHYQQPVFPAQQPGGQGGRGYNNQGPPHYGTSPQQAPNYANQNRNGPNYGGKHFGNHGQHQAPQGPSAPANNQSRNSDTQAEAK